MNWLQYCVLKGHVTALKSSAGLQNCSVRSYTTTAALLVNLIKKVPAILKSARLLKQGISAPLCLDWEQEMSIGSTVQSQTVFNITVRQPASLTCIILYGMHPQ